MPRRLWAAVIPAALFSGLLSPLCQAIAQAGMGFSAETATSPWRPEQLIQRVQYFTLGGSDYCWYGDGWNGPGWYECGDQQIYGFGWGGASGWNGWGGGDRIQPYRYHRAGVYHPGRPPVVGDLSGDPIDIPEIEPRQSFEGAPNRSGVPIRPGLIEGASPERPRPGARLEDRGPFGHEDLPGYSGFAARSALPDAAAPTFRGLANSPAPAFHEFGGGEGLQNFGFHDGGGFHGPGIHADAGIGGVGGFGGFHPSGGAMFSGGHIGGIGHR